MKLKKRMKRFMSILLVMAMTLSMFTMPVSAEEISDSLLADFNFDVDGDYFEGGNARATGNHTLVDHGDGKALNLNGNRQFLTVTAKDGSSLLTGYDELTVSFQMNASSSATNWMFYASPNTNQQNYQSEKYLGIFDNNGSITAERFNNNGSRSSSVSSTTGYGKWCHVTVVFTAATENTSAAIVLYVNGAPVAKTNSVVDITDLLGTNSILYIGRANWTASGEYATTQIDNYKIYGRALTAAEIEAEAAKYVDKAVLKDALAAAVPAEDKGKYTVATWTTYAEALAAAQEVYSKAVVTQAQVDSAVSALISAQNKLSERPDKSALQAEVDGRIADEDAVLYTAATWLDYQEELDDAQKVLDNENARQTAINSALSKVQSAKAALRLVGEAEDLPPEQIDAPLVKILTLSDYQKWLPNYSGDDWATLQEQLNDLVNGAYNAGVDPEYMFFGGDYSCMDSVDLSSTGMNQVNSIIRSKWPNLTDDKMINVQGNHDPAGTPGLAKTGPAEFDDFIVYVIREDDYPSKQGDSSVKSVVQSTVDNLTAWLEQKIDEEETRPIFLATHTGLHYDIDRTDGNNQYAYLLFEALNEAGKYLDIIYLFGHNHTNGDENVGGSLTCFQKGDTLDVCTETSIANRTGTTSVLNFTYMNYGYVGYIGDIYNNNSDITPTDALTMSELWLYEDRIEVYRYGYNGLIDSYSRTLDRDFYKEADFGKEYTLKYESNGGSIITSQYLTQGWTTVSRTAPAKAGVSFICWSTNEDGTGNRYNAGDSIYISKDTTLYAQYTKLPDDSVPASGNMKYTLTDTLLPGKEYLFVWSSDYYTNAGNLFALSDSTGNVTAIDSSWVSADRTEIAVPMKASNSVMRWDVNYNTGYNPGEGYLIQNVYTKNYLTYDGLALGFTKGPSTEDDWQQYFWYYNTDVTGGEGTAVDNLVPNSDDTRWIRFSVSSAQLKMGRSSTSTDARNSTPYIYVREDSAETTWKKVDEIQSNEEYLVVNSGKAGTAKVMTINGRTIGAKDVQIQTAEDGTPYIEYEAAYNNEAVVHSYQVQPGKYWLATWNNANYVYNSSLSNQGEVVYLYPTDGKIKVTGNFFDERYYTRFTYEEGVLTGFAGISGTASTTLVYKGGFTIGSGENVSLFKRVQTPWAGTQSGITDDHECVFGGYTPDGNATCYADGTQSRNCECGVVETIPLKDSKVDHDYKYTEGNKTDSRNHYYVCTYCGDLEGEAHCGGAATEDAQAICEVCGLPYTETNENQPDTPIVDRTALRDAVAAERDANLKAADYTAETWEAYKEALDKAAEVLVDAYATQDEVDAAVNALAKAKAELEAAPEPANEVYELVDTLTSGKEYIIAVESTSEYIYGSSNAKVALTDVNNFATGINKSWIADDLSSITVPEEEDVTAYTWAATEVDGMEDVYTLKNVATGKYLAYQNGNIVTVDEVADSCYWMLKVRVVTEDRAPIPGVSEVVTLTSYVSQNSFIRYSVGSKKYKIGTTGTPTDTANADISLYEKFVEKEPIEVELPYEDVIKDDWFYEAVYYNYIEGLMTGKSTTIFAPDASLSRAEFASVLYSANELPEVTYEAVFPDIAEEDWYAPAVIWANKEGIVNGYGSGLFGPTDPVAREQMAIMMYNYAAAKGYDTDQRDDLSAFNDAADVSWYAEEAMQWAVGAGVITGKDGGTRLDPYGATSRAECAAIMQKFMINCAK